MSADSDLDSRMASSPDASDIETPADQITSSLLSPPESQHHDTRQSQSQQQMPASASGVPGANANGKRPLHTISNGDESELIDLTATTGMASTGTSGTATSSTGKTRSGGQQEFAPKVHQPSGYTWSRAEDEPGYAWGNKKAVDERNRAWETMVHKECMVKNRYGDPFEAVEREQALINSIKQQ